VGTTPGRVTFVTRPGLASGYDEAEPMAGEPEWSNCRSIWMVPQEVQVGQSDDWFP